MKNIKFFPRGGEIILIAFIACLVFGCGGEKKTATTGNNFTVIDARGDKVTIPQKPQRIITFVPMTDEIVLGLVEPERMAAVNDSLADPNRSNLAAFAQKVATKIGRNPSVETVAALKPDLAIANSTWVSVEKVDALRALGIPVVVCHPPGKYDEILSTVRLIAKSVDEPERGERLIKKMEDELAALRAKIDKQPAEKKNQTIALISIMPAYGGAGSIFDDTCRLAGAKNAKALYGNKHGQAMTKEQLVECNPDFLFFPSYDNPNKREEKYAREFMDDPSLKVMKAVKNNHVCQPVARYIYNLSQNFVFGVQETAYYLYGDDFRPAKNRHLSAVE